MEVILRLFISNFRMTAVEFEKTSFRHAKVVGIKVPILMKYWSVILTV